MTEINGEEYYEEEAQPYRKTDYKPIIILTNVIKRKSNLSETRL